VSVNIRLPRKTKSFKTYRPGRANEAMPAPVIQTAGITTPRSATRVSPPAELTVDSVKYASLPRELKRIGLLTATALVVLILLWLIFR